MKATQIRGLRSKWTKTKVLLKHSSIKSFIPDTRKFNKQSLKTMIQKYGMVYVKPEQGTYGMGVMKAEKDGKCFAYQLGEKRQVFQTFDAFYASLSKQVRGKSYLIQKGIHLLKHNNRRFDIRVMVQINPKGKWEATGIIGRLGHPSKIVTNYHSGGKPLAIETLLNAHVTKRKLALLTEEMYELGTRIAGHLQKTYPNFKNIGVDIGLDSKFVPWIIEVNTNPDPYIFNQLKDKTMYRKVIKYHHTLVKKE